MIGWYLNVPGSSDSKKQKYVLRWATVSNSWLLLSSKPSDLSSALSIHLGCCDISPGLPEQRYPINTLLFRAQSPCGALPTEPFVIYTHNHFDFQAFHNAILQAKRLWDEEVASQNKPTLSAVLKIPKVGFLSASIGSKIDCVLSAEGFRLNRSHTESVIYEFNEMSSIRPGQGLSFELVVNRVGTKPEMMFQCRDGAEVRTFVGAFLLYIVRQLGKSS
jgi:hypothetical protein